MTTALIPNHKRKISPSSLNTWFKCPRLYYYKYIKFLDEEPQIHLTKGTIIHLVIQFFFEKYEKDLIGRALSLLNKYWEIPKKLKITKEEEEEAKEDCKKILKVFVGMLENKYEALISGKKAENKRHAFYLTRPKFGERKLTSDKYNLVGIIDAINTDFSGNTTIVDYKTGSVYGSIMSDDINRQLAFYALLYYLEENEYPKDVVANYVRYGERDRVMVTPSMIKKVIMDINHFIINTQSDLKGDYPKNETAFCNNKKFPCSFCDICAGNKTINDEHQQKLKDTFNIKTEDKKENNNEETKEDDKNEEK